VGTRTPDLRIMRPQIDSRKGKCRQDLRQSNRAVAEHLPNDTCQTDPDLAAVVAAWPELPAALRAGIVAMVGAASK
jgi:hypothetical protein